jgi:hypothetical protein
VTELKKSSKLYVYIPDTRGVELSHYGRGNLKIGPSVFTYSRLPGRPGLQPLGFDVLGDRVRRPVTSKHDWHGTCPGATEECERICYARRPVAEIGPVASMWLKNSMTDEVPPIPEECRLLRIHVSGDFDTVAYVENWIARLQEHVTAHGPDSLRVWAYTRSWRVPELLPALEQLRALPYVQLWASMDKSHDDEPPAGWRRAWIDGDPRAGIVHGIEAHSSLAEGFRSFEVQPTQASGIKALICPEETKHVRDCEECGFCFDGKRNDVVFLEH